jgi:hypothetical protein
MKTDDEEPATTTVCIEIPLKRDREIREERRKSAITKTIFILGGVLLVTVVFFVANKLLND